MKIDILGIKINTESKSQILEKIRSMLTEDKLIFIVTPYSESIVAAQKDEEFRKVLNSADLSLPDGIGILWAANFLGDRRQGIGVRNFLKLIISLLAIIFKPSYIRDPIPEKISGSEFIWDLAKLAESRGESIFLLGGFGDVPEKAAQALKARYPNLKIAGTYSDISKKCRGTRDDNVIKIINSAKPDFLFVALSPITQEKWIYRNLPNLRSRLAIGLGGTFDYLAKIRPYRPKNWASRGLEWLFRLLTQPWRVGRILKGVLGLIWYCLRFKKII